MDTRPRQRRIVGLEPLEGRLAPSSLSGAPRAPTPPALVLRRAQVPAPQPSRRGGALAQQRLNRAFAAFDRAMANLDLALDRLEAAGVPDQGRTLRAFNGALARTLTAESQLNRAFVAGPTTVQEANRARLQRALGVLAELNERIEAVQERLQGQLPAAGAAG